MGDHEKTLKSLHDAMLKIAAELKKAEKQALADDGKIDPDEQRAIDEISTVLEETRVGIFSIKKKVQEKEKKKQEEPDETIYEKFAKAEKVFSQKLAEVLKSGIINELEKLAEVAAEERVKYNAGIEKQLNKYLQELDGQYKKLKDEYENLSDIDKNSRRGRDLKAKFESLADAHARVQDKIEKARKDAQYILTLGDDGPDANDQGDFKNYDDVVFSSAFAQSIQIWANKAHATLNTARTFMIDSGSHKGLDPLDFLLVVESAMGVVSAAKNAYKVVNASIAATRKVLSVIRNGYHSSLPPKPDINSIQKAMIGGFEACAKADHKAAFEDYWKAWKKDNSDLTDGSLARSVAWSDSCSIYGLKMLPDPQSIAKDFLAKCVEIYKDSPNELWFQQDAGVVYVQFISVKKDGKRSLKDWKFAEGEIDDVDKGVVKAIKSTWDQEDITQLPFKIVFKLMIFMGDTSEVVRPKGKSGSTSFKHADGDKDLYNEFLSLKLWEQVKVRDLSA